MTNLSVLVPSRNSMLRLEINKIDLIDRHIVKDELNTKIYNGKFSSNELQFSKTFGKVDTIIKE